jgi:hypothetical protein
MRRLTSVLRDTYDYRYHHPGAPAQNPNTAVCDDEFGDWFGIGGAPSYVVDRIGELVELGLDFFVTALPPAEREQFAGVESGGLLADKGRFEVRTQLR